MNMFATEDPRVQQLKDKINKIDINTLTPIEALLKLQEIKKVIE